MFHISNFGSFADPLKEYADLDGYIPEYGDNVNEFNYPSDWNFDDESWQDFVSEAEIAKDSAQIQLRHWGNRI